MSRASVVASCALVLLLTACGGGAEPDRGPAAADAPTELAADGASIRVSTYAWQDQMPSVGDEPGPCASLCVNGTVEVAGGGPLPEDLEVVDIVAVVDGEELAFEEQELRGRLGPSNYEFVVRGGPPLQPGTTFDLAVRVRVDGEERWVRTAGVTVERTS